MNMTVPEINPVSPNERLVHLFDLQTAMQKANSQKRNEIVHPKHGTVRSRIQAAIYYWNAATVEYAELQISSFDSLPDDHVTEELVDMLHFILSQLLYSGFSGRELNTLDEYFGADFGEIEDGPEINKVNRVKAVHHYWSLLSTAWGELMDSMPYKIWKTYESNEMLLVHSKAQVAHGHGIMIYFAGICTHLNVDAEALYLGYINKNKENYKRQMSGGKYEK